MDTDTADTRIIPDGGDQVSGKLVDGTNPDKGDGNSSKLGGKFADGSAENDDDDADDVNEEDRDEPDANGVGEEEEEKFASDDSEAEWEDWEKNAAGSGRRPTNDHDDIISDEIEAELSQMSGGKNFRGVAVSGGVKVPTSPDPYGQGSSSTATAVEWPDPGFHSGLVGGGAPGPFGSDPAGGESDRQRTAARVVADTVGSPSHAADSSAKQGAGKGLKLGAKNNKPASAKSTPTKKPAAVAADDLGLGYDIKSIELTAVQEVDFFADMTPDIKASANKGLVLPAGAQLPGEAAPSGGAAAEGRVASDRFAMADAAAEVGGIPSVL